jgi:hypothetical protein
MENGEMMTFHPPAPFRFVLKNGDVVQLRIAYRAATFGAKNLFKPPNRSRLPQPSSLKLSSSSKSAALRCAGVRILNGTPFLSLGM